MKLKVIFLMFLGSLFLSGCATKKPPQKIIYFDKNYQPFVYEDQIWFNRFLKNQFLQTDRFIKDVEAAIGHRPQQNNRTNQFIYYK
ncbi:hypothetical protein [Caminibacter pacificus]|uniref:Lipoprotein n=1 Tax=Caminibacter pacificus TaxID=1424653 RepID=A0AAJ4UX55_9BACT|nr:hypothetical protein [Caminibacter pacificus]QDD68227.1 hypothetical protein C6V80_10250 [Caminibacter pacificus]ROR38741.1 hypothetical protein EDC58_1956 [Caminibacter pacificus]